MSGRWWRAYSRARHDPKLLRLSDKYHRWWFNFVCVAADNDGCLPSDIDLASEFRVSEKVIRDAINELDACGLLDWDEEAKCHKPHNWNGLQYSSDSAAERMRRYRQRHRDATVTEAVTSPLRSREDTEQIQSRTDKKPAQARKTKLPPDWKATEELLAYAAEQGCVDPKDTAERFRLHHQSKGTLALDWDLSFKYWCRNEKNFARPQSGAHGAQKNGAARTETINHDDLGQWQARLRGYGPGKYWNQGDWGPRPGEPGCRVPKPLLAELEAA